MTWCMKPLLCAYEPVLKLVIFFKGHYSLSDTLFYKDVHFMPALSTAIIHEKLIDAILNK